MDEYVKMERRIKEFCKRTRFYQFDAYRIDFDIQLVTDGKDLLIIKSNRKFLVDVDKARPLINFIKYEHAYYNTFSFLKEGDDIDPPQLPPVELKENEFRVVKISDYPFTIKGEPFILVGGTRKIIGPSGLQHSFWSETYFPDKQKEWMQTNPVLTAYNTPYPEIPTQIGGTDVYNEGW